MPWDPQQRLIACRNGIASYLYRHMHRISAYVCVFLTVIVILWAVSYHQGLIALLAVLFYLGLLVLLVLLTSNKEAILGLLPQTPRIGLKRSSTWRPRRYIPCSSCWVSASLPCKAWVMSTWPAFS
jgi:hypothetical protein